jgi:hypothetical protein
MTLARNRARAGALVVAFAVAAGCMSPGGLLLGPSHDANLVPAGAILEQPAGALPGLRPPRHVLALSGGGLYGAYSVGVLDGWTRTGTRPEFDVVTGVSTGALIAPFAFLGPEYDARAMALYTGVRNGDIFRLRSLYTLPFRDALASSGPLRRLIGEQIDECMMAEIARAHRAGRRLYVATTDLRTKRAAIWDMGAIACMPCPEGCALFRDVLLASASVPGVFPPVPFDTGAGRGPLKVDLHVDGGATAPLFVPPGVFAAAGADGANPGAPGAPNVYAIVAGKYYPEAGRVRRRILPVVSASTEAVLSAQLRAELSGIYWQSRVYGVRFHTVGLRQDAQLEAPTSVSFSPKLMSALYKEGQADGVAGPRWLFVPPALSPTDDGAVRDPRLGALPAVPLP